MYSPSGEIAEPITFPLVVTRAIDIRDVCAGGVATAVAGARLRRAMALRMAAMAIAATAIHRLVRFGFGDGASRMPLERGCELRSPFSSRRSMARSFAD